MTNDQQLSEAVTARAASLMNEAIRRAGIEAIKRGVRINDGMVFRAFCELAAVRIANLELALGAIVGAATPHPHQAPAATPPADPGQTD